jgi:hypothetical protein
VGSPQINTLEKKDAEFVLDSAGLGDKEIVEVVHSYIENPLFSGDYMDIYALKINPLTDKEITDRIKTDSENIYRWYKGDSLPVSVSDAVGFISDWVLVTSNTGGNDFSWFPTEKEIRTGDIYVYLRNVYYSSATEQSAASIIFIRPADGMIFYASSKI